MRRRAALEGGYLVNEAIRELVAPIRVMELTRRWERLNPVPIAAIGAVRNMILRSLIINLYRVQEARDNFLCPWVFSDGELRTFGMPPMQEFVGGVKAWSAFEVLRHQYAGHGPRKRARTNSPGALLPAERLGAAIRDSGLRNLEGFLEQIETVIAPALERVRDEISRQYPALRDFIQQYAISVEAAAR